MLQDEFLKHIPVAFLARVNNYFLHHREMVLGNWSIDGRLYDSGYSLKSKGNLEPLLRTAIERLPKGTVYPDFAQVVRGTRGDAAPLP